MKHLFTFLLVAISATSFAQGNLQFNQAVYDEIISTPSSNTGPPAPVIGDIVVGPGKVLKITAVSYSVNSGGPYTENGGKVWIGGLNVYGVPGWICQFPIWLPEGTYPVSVVVTNSNWGDSRIFSYSGIEFNVVP